MSNTQKKNVPELRFPGFEGEYSLDIFGNLATNKSDKFNPQNENASIDIELDCIEQNTGRLIKIYNSKEFSSQKNKFNPQNVLYGKLRPYLNKYYFTKKSGVCSSEIWVLKSTKEDKLLNLFLYYFIQTKRYSDVASKSAGSKMPRADWGLIENIRVYFPELCEQQKIGEFFSKLDRQIELEEQKLELLQQQKKGYMQKIFSQELRFKDENGNDYPEWVVKLIGDIGKVAMNKRIYKHETSANEEIPFYKIGDFGKKADTFISREQFNEYKEKYPYPKKGDILISASGSIGKTIEYKGEEAYYQDSNIVWLDHNEEVLNVFLKYFYILVKWNGVEGTTIKRLYNKNILNTKIDLPTISEQQKIGDFFCYIDNLIEIQEQKLEFLKRRKQSLLQKMFV
ncbi:Restriction endonuclease subunit S [Staphylococcus aureus]|uniref:restriction endonuclease subunit S n=1 Tax=Staphylococcus aureus TaxID=1280 RepID=UPI001C8983C7|nr:restriction endonuclease subunit S [Staphylococcus aureus]MBX8355500.1 restriction endonuclease subunit S [Staphylococcus aureus]HCG2840178.1 restriction endonuclease subunit S [Staphylococcus aureus]HDK9411555.1 restriction endonuclease subunit S [Staphylococcus aureus]